MKIFIALLRGINVSGKNIIKMDALKTMFLNLEFENVQTYIQSGNVIFSTNKNDSHLQLADFISKKIKESFELNVPVLVLEQNELKTILKQLPFTDFDEKNMYFTFLNQTSKITDYSKILEKKSATEKIQISDKVVYLDCTIGYGNTKLSNNFIEKQLNVLCTTRNLKTCKKLLELANTI